MLGATLNVEVEVAELREASAAAEGPKTAHSNFRGLGWLWCHGSTDGRQQVSQRTIATEEEVQQVDPSRIDAVRIDEGVNFLAHQA